jgi:hypothetical protein
MTGGVMFVKSELDEFGHTFERYASLWKGDRKEALQRASKNFAFILWTKLRQAVEPKGAITTERVTALKAGSGLKISARARELVARRYGVSQSIAKRNMISNKGSGELGSAMVAQELRLREGHRMFTASAARFKGDLKSRTFSISRGKHVGSAKPVSGGPESDRFEFEWGSSVAKWSGVAAVGLNKETRRRYFGPALRETRADMLRYIDRKKDEFARRAAGTLRSNLV